MRQRSFKTIGSIVAVAVSLLILFAAGYSVLQIDEQSRTAGLQVADQAINRAVMQCYALEGAYPPSLDYLEQNYGLLLDRNKYVYQYEVVAGNIFPIIGVTLPGSNES